jgi:hypothetical protein
MPNTINGLITAVTGVLAGLIIETAIRRFVDAGLRLYALGLDSEFFQ